MSIAADYYAAIAYYYYYVGGYYGDYYGYNLDSYGTKSGNFKGSTTYGCRVPELLLLLRRLLRSLSIRAKRSHPAFLSPYPASLSKREPNSKGGEVR